MRKIEPPELSDDPRALAEGAISGLEVLRELWSDRGAHGAVRGFEKVLTVLRTSKPFVSLEYAIHIGNELDGLAYYYDQEGWFIEAQRWRAYAKHLRRRALIRGASPALYGATQI